MRQMEIEIYMHAEKLIIDNNRVRECEKREIDDRERERERQTEEIY